jgi:hypothetical protein
LSASDFDSSGGEEEVERLAARLAELRAGYERVKQRRLEPNDWAVVRAMLSELIEQAEAGQCVSLELSDEEEASSGTNEAVGAEESKE